MIFDFDFATRVLDVNVFPNVASVITHFDDNAHDGSFCWFFDPRVQSGLHGKR